MDVIENIKKILKRKYIYVPPCPRCGCKATGYILQTDNWNSIRLKIKAARRGEIMECISYNEPFDANAFCTNCGIHWFANLEKRELSQEIYEEECEDRDIGLYMNYMDNIEEEAHDNLKKANKSQNKIGSAIKNVVKYEVDAIIPFKREVTKIYKSNVEKNKMYGEMMSFDLEKINKAIDDAEKIYN